MQELVPIKVRIGLDDSGKHRYPNFNNLPADIRHNMDWAYFIDKHGLSWHYNAVCGHADFEEGDDYGCAHGEWAGCLCVPESFADAAVAAFPDDVKYITEAEFQDFYDNKAHIREPEFNVDEEVMKSFEIKHNALGMQATADLAYLRAIDPEDPAPGIRKNHNRYYKDFKAKRNFIIKDKAKKKKK